MKYRIWSVCLKAAAVRHQDPDHRAQLLRLAEELGALDRLPPVRGPGRAP